MARPKLPDPTLPTVKTNLALARADMEVLDALTVEERARIAATEALAARLSYDGSVSEAALEEAIRLSRDTASRATAELGRALLLLKERVDHGSFLATLERIDIPVRGAQRLMAVALRMVDPNWRKLTNAAANPSAVIEMLVLHDDEVDKLANGQSVGELTLDKIDRMTNKELRSELRKRDLKMKAKDDIVVARNEEIESLRLKSQWQPSKSDLARNEKEHLLIEALTKKLQTTEVEVAKLMTIIADGLKEHGRNQHIKLRTAQALSVIATRCWAVANDFNLAHDIPKEFELPEWARPVI